MPPIVKPKIEFIKVTKAINKAGFRMWLPNSDNVIPAENASMLVAIPTNNKHLKSMHNLCSLFGSKASSIILHPKYMNIKHTVNPA